MEIITVIVTALLDRGTELLTILGWVLFLVERYIVSRAKDQQHREDIDAFRSDFKDITADVTGTLGKFVVLLEVIRDRIGR